MRNGIALFVRFNLVDDVGNALKVSSRHRCLSVGVGVHFFCSVHVLQLD